MGETVNRAWWAPADILTVIRIPLAVGFVVMTDADWRIGILALAAASDFADGFVARRWGGSRLGAFLDPVADKLFMACAFGVVLVSGALNVFEIVAVLIRDIVTAIAFAGTVLSGRPASIPARLGGKAVTIGQLLTVLAFLTASVLLRPLAWGTAAVALYALWDYQRAASRLKRPLGQ